MIADLGLSKHLTEVKTSSKNFGMQEYFEPQYFKQHGYKKNEKSDIYSLGILFWEISSGEPPFSEIPLLEILNGKRELPIKNTPLEYQQLYENCWKEEPEQRPDINKIHEILFQLKLQFTNNEVITTQNFNGLNINNSGTSTETCYNDSHIGSLDLLNGKLNFILSFLFYTLTNSY